MNLYRGVFQAASIVALLSGVNACAGSIKHDLSANTWTLTSGPATYRLGERGKILTLDYFGPASKDPGSNKSKGAAEIAGIADGLNFASTMRIAEVQQQSVGDIDTLTFNLRGAAPELEIRVVYAAYGNTGVFSRQESFRNLSDKAIQFEKSPSLSMVLAPGNYTLRSLYGGWGQEHQLAVETLGGGGRSFGSDKGRSTNGFAPWISLRNEDQGTEYLAGFAWSGNWDARIWRQPGTSDHTLTQMPVDVEIGVHWDFGGSLRLMPHAQFELPKVALTTSTGDMDDVSNQMHRYQRAFVFPQTNINRPPLVQFNSWYPFPGKMTLDDLKKLADSASTLGAEVFVLDAGWYGTSENWQKQIGDYHANPVIFPRGMEELSSYLASRKLKFGLWVEIESLGQDSRTLAEHPDWCMQYEGKPLSRSRRCHLNFAKPDVQRWASETVNRLVNEYHLSWLKIDYNIDAGDHFDPHGQERPGDILAKHVQAYYAWLDAIRAAHPELVIENCSSGALRMDTGILAHTHTNWASDNVNPIDSVQIAYGCTVQFAPEVCNHWMVGDMPHGAVDLAKPPGWWDFMFRVPMNGQFGISSRIFDWNDALNQRARANVLLYKQIRSIITNGDVYHLTPAPAHKNPEGWMAIQYVDPKAEASVLMAYRLNKGNATQSFRLHGLDAHSAYDVAIDGHAAVRISGKDLMDKGFGIELAEDWRSAVVQIKRLL